MVKNQEKYEKVINGSNLDVKLAVSTKEEGDDRFYYGHIQNPDSENILLYRKNKNGGYEIAVFRKEMVIWDHKQKGKNKNVVVSAISPLTVEHKRTENKAEELKKALEKNGIKYVPENVKFTKTVIGSTQTNELMNCSIVDVTNQKLNNFKGEWVSIDDYKAAIHDSKYIKTSTTSTCLEILDNKVLSKDASYKDNEPKQSTISIPKAKKAKTSVVGDSPFKDKNGYPYMSIIKGPDGKDLIQRRTKISSAVICVRKNKNGENEYMVRFQGQNLYDTDYQKKFHDKFPDTITGSIEEQPPEEPKENALHELNEEAGFKLGNGNNELSAKNIVSENRFIPSSNSNEVVHLIVVDVTGVKQNKNLKGAGDGTLMETKQENKWMTEAQLKDFIWLSQNQIDECVNKEDILLTSALTCGINDAKHYLNKQIKQQKKVSNQQNKPQNTKEFEQMFKDVDIVADGLQHDLSQWSLLNVAINNPQQIEAIQYNGKNIKEVEEWCQANGGKLTKGKDGKYSFLIWGNTPAELKKGQWLSDYKDGTFGLIADEEFKKVYVNDGDMQFHKQQTATSVLSVDALLKQRFPNETAKKLDGWIGRNEDGSRKWKIDVGEYKVKGANGKEEVKEGPCFFVQSKEQWQAIPFGLNQSIIKDSTGGVYPQTAESLKKRYSVCNIEQIKQQSLQTMDIDEELQVENEKKKKRGI